MKLSLKKKRFPIGGINNNHGILHLWRFVQTSKASIVMPHALKYLPCYSERFSYTGSGLPGFLSMGS